MKPPTATMIAAWLYRGMLRRLNILISWISQIGISWQKGIVERIGSLKCKREQKLYELKKEISSIRVYNRLSESCHRVRCTFDHLSRHEENSR